MNVALTVNGAVHPPLVIVQEGGVEKRSVVNTLVENVKGFPLSPNANPEAVKPPLNPNGPDAGVNVILGMPVVTKNGAVAGSAPLTLVTVTVIVYRVGATPSTVNAPVRVPRVPIETEQTGAGEAATGAATVIAQAVISVKNWAPVTRTVVPA